MHSQILMQATAAFSQSDSSDLEQYWRKPTSDAFCWKKRYCGLAIMAHCRTTTISLSHSLRCLSAHPVKQLALCVSFSRWRSNRNAHLCYCSAGSVQTHGDTHFVVNYKTLCVTACRCPKQCVLPYSSFVPCLTRHTTEKDGTKKIYRCWS